jgi:hypothetical protein
MPPLIPNARHSTKPGQVPVSPFVLRQFDNDLSRDANDAESLPQTGKLWRRHPAAGGLGVTVEKRELMPVQFTRQELDQQRRIKWALDPGWLLNAKKSFFFPLSDRP